MLLYTEQLTGQFCATKTYLAQNVTSAKAEKPWQIAYVISELLPSNIWHCVYYKISDDFLNCHHDLYGLQASKRCMEIYWHDKQIYVWSVIFLKMLSQFKNISGAQLTKPHILFSSKIILTVEESF